MKIRPDTRIEIAQRLHKDMQPSNLTRTMLQEIAKNVAHTNYEDPLGRIFETSASLMHHDDVTINIRLDVLLPGWQEERGYWAERANPEEQASMSLRDEVRALINDVVISHEVGQGSPGDIDECADDVIHLFETATTLE